MKRYPFFPIYFGVAICAALLFTYPGPGAVAGGGSWWDKGVSILKDLSKGQGGEGLTLEEIAGGLKEALRVATGNVVSRLGRENGFSADPQVHIPLPGQMATVKRYLSKVGMSGLLDDLEMKMNRAAEAATPRAKELFLKAIGEMTFEDIQGVYKGPDDAATRYFREKMSPGLSESFRPIVQNTLAQVGAVRSYEDVMGKYRSLPFVPDVKADLTNHVVQKGIDGIFVYLAKEEAAIRKDPAKRTTELLRRVFGNLN